MSERSEFGHRAHLAEKRRAPMRLYRIGKRQEQWSLVTFCRNRK